METTPIDSDLLAQLRVLRDDLNEMRSVANEVEARGYSALLASTAFSDQAHQLRDRIVRLFGEVARFLEAVEDAQGIRWRLLRASQQLAAVFRGASAATLQVRKGPLHVVQKPLTLRDLLDIAGFARRPCDGLSLYEEVVSVSEAAHDALLVRRP